ncbi:MAG: 2-hydroxyacid dehydrogenase [Chloroflexota bacterium]
MPKPKVFVTRLIPKKGLDIVLEFCEADVWPEAMPPSREELLRRARGVDGILSLLTDRVDAEVMDAAGPGLKVISNHAVGFDNVDVAAATARRIPVGNTPGILTDATADMAFALLLAAARRLAEGAQYVKDGRWKTWEPSLLLGADFVGATLGLVGFGRIGRAVAKRAQGFDLRVIYHDPSAEPAYGAAPVDFETLLRESDFISLHVPLTDETFHLINAGTLAKMKPTAVLVNTSRGGVVDPSALEQTLRSRQIFAAALDVTEPEPIQMNDPLLALDNCLIVPHLGSASKQTREMMSYLAAQNLVAGLKGERLPHCVNPEVYER